MPFFDPIRIGASGAAADYTVDRSLRFNDDDSAYLRKSDFGSSDSGTTFTFSAWIKRGNLDVWVPIAGSHSGSNAFTVFGINPQNELVWRIRNSSSVDLTRLETTQVLRDPNAWYHVLLERNSTLSSSSDRAKLYINGVRVTDFSQNTKDSQNLTYSSDFLTDINIGRFQRSSSTIDYGDFYLAEYHYIDGQAYDPSYFTETDTTTGQLIPKKYTGSYGTNGFYLNFSDNSGTTATTMGKDSSGNGNNFTPNNFVTGDAVKDSPTNNFCTLNPLNANKNRGQASFFEGNLRMTSTSGNRGFTAGTMKAQGKIYFEVLNKSNSGFVGICEIDRGTHQSLDFYQGTPRIDGSAQSGTGQFSSGDIMGVKVDIDAKSIEFFRNGSSVYSATYTTDVEYFPFIEDTSGGRSTDAIANFGQDSSFAGEKTAQGNTDANGKGDFYYSVPSGYLSLCSANLPDPTILLPNKHFDTLLYSGNGSSQSITGLQFQPDWLWIKKRNGSENHEVQDSVRGATKRMAANVSDVETTVTGSISSFNSDGFTVGDAGTTNENGNTYVAWNWNAGDTDGKTYTVKVVSDSGNKYRFDDFGTSAVTLDLAEGGTYIFDQSDSSNSGHPLRFSTTSDGTHGGGSEYTTGVTTSGTPGSSGAYTQIVVASSAPTLYYYCTNHSGMGGQANTNSTLGSSNFDGNNQSTVKVNASAGFSIVGYVGNGVNNSNITMGHGLGVAPDFVIVKNRDTSPYGAREWVVWHQDVGTDSSVVYKNLTWNTTVVPGANSDQFRNVDANTIQVRSSDSTNGKVNANNNKYIAYVFSAVDSYSKFGKYTGNNANDGTFIFTGFSVAWLMVKRIDSSRDWIVYDNKRSIFNVIDDFLEPNNSGSEQSSSSNSVDFLSNGFKFRNTSGDMNGAGTYLYFAFAEAPFKNARAR